MTKSFSQQNKRHAIKSYECSEKSLCSYVLPQPLRKSALFICNSKQLFSPEQDRVCGNLEKTTFFFTFFLLICCVESFIIHTTA